MDASVIASVIAATLNAGTPLLIAAIGILIHEKSGVLNLGVEGMMLMGAVTGFGVTYATGSFVLGFFAGACAGLAMAALFGAGLSAFVGQPLQGMALPARASAGIPGLESIPFLGQAFFSSHSLVYLSLIGLAAVGWFLYKSRPGLMLRAVGESPTAAYALGYNVRVIRFWAVLFGGFMSGLAGAYLSLVYTPLWAEGMTAGRGWIALALVTFATWRPLRVVLGAYLFGGVTMLQFNMQAMGIEIPSQIMSMTPYLATILVLILISRNPKWIALNVPASLGKTFHPRN